MQSQQGHYEGSFISATLHCTYREFRKLYDHAIYATSIQRDRPLARYHRRSLNRNLDYLRFFVITGITLFSKYMPIAMYHWRLYARHNDISWFASVDLGVAIVSICFAKRCFLFTQSRTQSSCLRNVVSNQPEIAVRYGCVHTAVIVTPLAT